MMVAMPQISTPIALTLSDSSKNDYSRRYNQLVRAAKRQTAAETGQPMAVVQITPAGLVDFVIGRKRGYAANSWRQVRRSVVWSLEEWASRVAPVAAKLIMAQVDRLRGEQADPDRGTGGEDFEHKGKEAGRVRSGEIEQAALAQRAKCKNSLMLYLRVGVLTGLRPCEWPRAELRRSTREGFAWMLVVANAKATNQRAHGSHRTLYFVELDTQTVDDILAWIQIARDKRYQRLLNTIAGCCGRSRASSGRIVRSGRPFIRPATSPSRHGRRTSCEGRRPMPSVSKRWRRSRP